MPTCWLAQTTKNKNVPHTLEEASFHAENIELHFREFCSQYVSLNPLWEVVDPHQIRLFIRYLERVKICVKVNKYGKSSINFEDFIVEDIKVIKF